MDRETDRRSDESWYVDTHDGGVNRRNDNPDAALTWLAADRKKQSITSAHRRHDVESDFTATLVPE